MEKYKWAEKGEEGIEELEEEREAGIKELEVNRGGQRRIRSRYRILN